MKTIDPHVEHPHVELLRQRGDEMQRANERQKVVVAQTLKILERYRLVGGKLIPRDPAA